MERELDIELVDVARTGVDNGDRVVAGAIDGDIEGAIHGSVDEAIDEAAPTNVAVLAVSARF